MNLKKIAATASMTGALGLAAVGLGSGAAQAGPDFCEWLPGKFEGPGPGCLAPPGHLNKFFGPPGHWDVGGHKVNPGWVNHW
jgi:hypothetical protein